MTSSPSLFGGSVGLVGLVGLVVGLVVGAKVSAKIGKAADFSAAWVRISLV
jgi:hypothetical protein